MSSTTPDHLASCTATAPISTTGAVRFTAITMVGSKISTERSGRSFCASDRFRAGGRWRGAARDSAESVMSELEQEIAALIIQALRLEITVADFDPAAPLYGDPLGLDS